MISLILYISFEEELSFFLIVNATVGLTNDLIVQTVQKHKYCL